MSPRWDGPQHAAERPDDDDRRDTRRSESTEQGEDRDRADPPPEQGEDRDRADPSPEQGEGSHAERPDTWAETAEQPDRAEERAATAEAAQAERTRGAHSVVDTVKASVGALVVAAASVVNVQATENRLLDAVVEPIRGMVQRTQQRKKEQEALENAEPDGDPEHQRPLGGGSEQTVEQVDDPADGLDSTDAGEMTIEVDLPGDGSPDGRGTDADDDTPR
ncbi:hypothetical protein [Micromonospora profundi]|uniref:hypothetical protein n=1 Tax=Micromonospora profundi TaxID=1420889 RepID=UPI002FEED2B4